MKTLRKRIRRGSSTEEVLFEAVGFGFSVKVGDIAQVLFCDDNLRPRIGIITGRAAQRNCFVVHFNDGKSPVSNSYHIKWMEVISESR